MLKIYNSYYMYQLDHGEWNRFGYTGWFCTFILRRPYLHFFVEWLYEPINLFKKDFSSISIIEVNEEKKNVTLEWIMEHLSADKAIQFLKERGMAVCPIKQ